MEKESSTYRYWFNTLFMNRSYDGTLCHTDRGQVKFSKLVIVTGTVGNRSDLLAGWLADSHPERFNAVNWHIFPAVGKSQIHHAVNWPLIKDVGDKMVSSIKQGQSNNDLDSIKHIVNDFVNRCHDVSSKWTMTKSHYTSWFLAHVIPREHWDKFLVVDLLVSDSDSVRRLLWERFVKNILWPIKTSIDQTQHDYSKVSDRLIAQQLGKREAKSVISEAERYADETLVPAMLHLDSNLLSSPILLGDCNRQTDLADFPAISVDYREIMQPGGITNLLCDLGVATDKTSDWDRIYPLAQSPDRVFAGGRFWVNPVL